MPVVSHLVGHQHDDRHTNGHAYGKTKNIQGREKFIPGKVANGNQKIIADHGKAFECLGALSAEVLLNEKVVSKKTEGDEYSKKTVGKRRVGPILNVFHDN
jgi:hypothetical protein